MLITYLHYHTSSSTTTTITTTTASLSPPQPHHENCLPLYAPPNSTYRLPKTFCVYGAGCEVPLQLAVRPNLYLVFLPVCPLPFPVRQPVLMHLSFKPSIVFIYFVQYVVQYDARNYPLRNARVVLLCIFTNSNR